MASLFDDLSESDAEYFEEQNREIAKSRGKIRLAKQKSEGILPDELDEDDIDISY